MNVVNDSAFGRDDFGVMGYHSVLARLLQSLCMAGYIHGVAVLSYLLPRVGGSIKN